MVVERSTKQQVQAYRFGLRRVEQALATGRAEAIADNGPRPGVSLVIGTVVGGLVLAGFAVFGFLKPAPAIGDATVLIDTDSGGAFVVRDGVAHPALNLASALLAASATEKPAGAAGSTAAGGDAAGVAPKVAKVTTATLGTLPKGQLLGIPGAPNQVPAAGALASNVWQVCDLLSADAAAAPGTVPSLTTTVVIGGAGVPAADPATAFLVSTDDNSTHLIMGGRRSRLEATDAALAEGLGIDLTQRRRIGLGTLNAIPEGKPLVRPQIPQQGKTVDLGGESFTIGEIVRVERATGGIGFYVALSDGVQQVGPVAADVIRAVTGQGERVRTVPPAAVANAPQSTSPLATDAFPVVRPHIVGPQEAPGLCVDWRVVGDTPQWRVDPTRTLPIAPGARPVPAPPTADQQARAKAGSADQVYLAPGSGLAVGQTSVGATATAGNLFLVTDQGIAYPVTSPSAMRALGLSRTTPAPPEFVSLLPLGPTLDPAAARRYFTEAPAAPAN